LIRDHDDSERLVETIARANEQSNQVLIRGHGSKRFLTGDFVGNALQTQDHTGILSYEPEELVVTVRSGTSLETVRNLLASQNQMLPFDPPSFGGAGTVGGAIASGFSGPSRPWNGSLRDSLLGIEMVNGLGQRLKFGGQVMKNVAGFDLSRLMAGSFGTLGLILSASFKVIPKPRVEISFAADISPEDASACYRKILQLSNHVRGSYYDQKRMYLLATDVEAMKSLDLPEFKPHSEIDRSFWNDIRDHKTEWFSNSEKVVRIVLPRGQQLPPALREHSVEEWHGTLAWYSGNQDLTELLPQTKITNFRGISKRRSLPSIMIRLQNAFDPNGVFANHFVI